MSKLLAIRAEELTRRYRQKRKPTESAGKSLSHRLLSIWRYESEDVLAVDRLSFEVQTGERVAFVGPNGAGKSTTIKMLAGILTPSSGICEVAGFNPTTDRIKVAHAIGTVFGQRSQLWHHLPVIESCYLLGAIYDLRRHEVRDRLKTLAQRFDMEALLPKTCKQLSLGERMRCELVASLLHRPRVLFLDEPTIGLDVVGKASLRDLVRQMGEEEGCTVLLTSHDTGDMEQVCDRVLVINGGKLVVDAPVSKIRESFLAEKHITVRAHEPVPDIVLPNVVSQRVNLHEMRLTIDTRRTGLRDVMQHVISTMSLADLRVEDAPMEEVIKTIYARGAAAGSGK